MPAGRIERAEVTYNAPARMQVRGAVINIVLKHQTDGDAPLKGEFNLSWNQQHDARFGERGTLLYNRGKLAIDFMYLHSHGDAYKTTDEASRHTLDDGSVHAIDTREISRSAGYGHDYRLGMDYLLGGNHRFSMVYTGNYDRKKVHQLTSGNVSGDMRIGDHTWLHNLRMDYQTSFGLKAGAEQTYYHNPETQRIDSDLPTGTLEYAVDNEQRVNRWKFFLSQEHALKHGWGINYGAFWMVSVNHSRQLYTDVSTTTGYTPESSFTRQREDVVNIYAGCSRDFSRQLMADASFAAEYWHNPVWHQWHFYPTLNLTYIPAQGHVFQLGISSDRRYPDYWAMTNFITYANGGYNEITGNPDLRPQTTWQLQLVYVLKNKYQFVGWVKHDDRYFVQSPYQRHDRLTVSYTTLNFNFQQQAGVQAALPFRWGQWLDARLQLIGVWQREKADRFYDIPFDRHVVFGMARLNSTVTLSSRPDITVSMDGMIRSKAIQATYDLPASGNVDISARWQFWNKRAAVRIFCNDLFETSVINPRIHFKGQNLRMDFSCYREAGVSFTYRFGGYKEKKRTEVDTDRFKR